jgi:hypothetical protein
MALKKLNGLAMLQKKASKTKAEFFQLGKESTPTPNNQLKAFKMGYYAFVADIYGEGNYPKIHKKQENKLDITKIMLAITKDAFSWHWTNWSKIRSKSDNM